MSKKTMWERGGDERERRLRKAVAFVERLTRVKSNRHHGIIAEGGGLARRPREHFLDYCLRVQEAFPKDHKLPSVRLRKR